MAHAGRRWDAPVGGPQAWMQPTPAAGPWQQPVPMGYPPAGGWQGQPNMQAPIVSLISLIQLSYFHHFY